MMNKKEVIDMNPKMGKYAWNFDGDGESWDNDTFDTVEECIAKAKEAADSGDYWTREKPKVVYIGETSMYIPYVEAEYVLEDIQEQACDNLGEVAHDWDAYNYEKKDELKELDEKLTEVLHEWMHKYGYFPAMWSIENIKEYSIS